MRQGCPSAGTVIIISSHIICLVVNEEEKTAVGVGLGRKWDVICAVLLSLHYCHIGHKYERHCVGCVGCRGCSTSLLRHETQFNIEH